MEISRFQLPEAMEKVLARDPSLHGYVHSQFARISTWQSMSGAAFFPNYTDHGLGHISRVLAIADWLLDDGAWQTVSDDDIACLALSALLHDSALYLTTDSFRSLVTSNTELPIIDELDSSPWAATWSEFVLEVKHWDNATWLNIVGAEWKAQMEASFGKAYSIDYNNITEIDLRVIGEFIRRNHSRLAHEFAVHGIPGPSGSSLQLDPPPRGAELLDLAGLVARSHAMEVRDTYKYMISRYSGLQEMGGIHPVFLMVVLRIADYLDLYAERAPNQILKVKQLRSPVSEGEWATHQAIREIRLDVASDPETVEIIAAPSSAAVYQSLLKWIGGIQMEMDKGWAVLGEVFGRYDRLRPLKLRIRRISSPIVDVARFSEQKKLPFLPVPASIRADTRRLLPALIKPLYGDRPEVAVRELLQNAVDAVRERDAISADGMAQVGPVYDELRVQVADIAVTLCSRSGNSAPSHPGMPKDWQYWLEVVDRGVGMNENTIRQHFLTAGSSFRYSPEFYKRLSEDQRLGLFRSGKFGIGALAPFVAGHEVVVTSRSFDATKGIEFSFDIDMEDVELRWCEAPFGTRVCVRLEKEVFGRLERERGAYPTWERGPLDWFALGYPSVFLSVRRDQDVTTLEQRYKILGEDDPEWNFTKIGDALAFQWTIKEGNYSFDLYLNGLFLESTHYSAFRSKFGNELKPPVLNVFDSTDQFPVALSRDRLSAEFPYRDELVIDMLMDHIAWLLIQAGLPSEFRCPMRAPAWRPAEYQTGSGDASEETAAYALTSSGLIPATRWHLTGAKARKLSCLISGMREGPVWRELLRNPPADVPLLLCRFNIYGGFSEPYPKVVTRYMLHAKERFDAADWSLVLPRGFGEKLEPWIREYSAEIIRVDLDDFIEFRSAATMGPDEQTLRAFFLADQEDSRDLLHGGETRGAIGLMSMKLGKRKGKRQDVPENLRHQNSVEPVLANLWSKLALPAVLPVEIPALRLALDGRIPELRKYLDRNASVLDKEGLFRTERWWF